MTKKLFLGIALDKQQRHQLYRLQSSFDTDVRLVPTTNLHMTLAFFGPLSSPEQQRLEKQITAMNRSRFNVNLDTLAHWKKPRILCLTGQTSDPALLQLAQQSNQLANAFNKCPNEHLFRAHITLARRSKSLPDNQKPFTPVRIDAHSIHLFESKSTDSGVEYRILRSWPLH
ncbi:RNA 2',3'-cyclic phosphodiesterase [Psychromonas ossibalaenae]|uniref:RNA 2',3'-cyclic phosphodiesterase n=1 Tax=Psychromonas ossibalaenae TaxID=444922 RepID=UPI000363439D|nr:RNA 2',3'-cyclic phosphodiesterase [Psychromonas ossibalaenae]